VPRFAAVALVALVLASCGGDDRDPGALLRDAAAAMRQVQSMHLEGTAVTAAGRYSYDADVARNGRIRYSLRLAGQRMEMVRAGVLVFLRGNASFWRANGGPDAARRLQDRWVEAPEQAVASVAGRLARLTPEGLAVCLAQPTGKLSYRGTATVGGQQAHVIADAGDHPGDAPGRLYVQAHGPARVLRAVQTGHVTPGPGADPRCSNSGASPIKGDVRLSRFDQDVTIAIPKGAIRLDARARTA
jgi:hypothetical protein